MLKISLPGFDVKTTATENLAVDSSYDSLKLIIRNTNPYFGTIKVNFTDNPGNGTYNIFRFKHELGYNPLYYVFFDSSQSSKSLFTQGLYETDTHFGVVAALPFQEFIVSDTGDGFSLDYVVTNNSAFDITAQYFSFRYFVYANDGI